MKRKLITFLAAVMAVVGFQANAQITVAEVGIEAAEKAIAKTDYAKKQTNLPTKLTWSNTSGKIVYAMPDAKVNTALDVDRFRVSKGAGNTIVFVSVESGETLSFTKGNTPYSQFTVFYAAAAGATQQLLEQPFNNGSFEGYLAANAAGEVGSAGMMIVVITANGTLDLVPYGSIAANQWPLYIKTKPLGGRWATPDDFEDCRYREFIFNGQKLSVLNAAGTQSLVMTGSVSGANATQYSVFTAKQVDFVANQTRATSAAAGDLDLGRNIIAWTKSWNGKYGATFEGFDQTNGGDNAGTYSDAINGNNYYGTAQYSSSSTAQKDSVIPLFTLATSQNGGCQVLSVSRMNQLYTQNEADAVYANRLEVRDYGTYYSYTTSHTNSTLTNNYTAKSIPSTATQEIYDRYTSLQKFAIWITERGEYILYPAASYFWNYGEIKERTIGQQDDIRPNAALVYNNIKVREVSTTPAAQSNKRYGTQIGWWDASGASKPTGITGITYPNPVSAIVTAPAWIQTASKYSERKFKYECADQEKDLSGRFFFIEVENPDTTGIARTGATATDIEKAFYNGGYQDVRTGQRDQYVLSTQVGPDGNKYLAIVPKEKVTAPANQTNYWLTPYDSVNMAAHWEIQKVYDKVDPTKFLGYRMINMLGDTLKYNFSDPATSIDPELVGGSLTVNSLWSGYKEHDWTSSAATTEYIFGRPTDAGRTWDDEDYWFDINPNASGAAVPSPLPTTLSGTYSYDVWKLSQSFSGETFSMELANHLFEGSISLAPMAIADANAITGVSNTSDYHAKGWFRLNNYGLGAYKVDPNLFSYYQQYVKPVFEQKANLNSFGFGEVQPCSGLVFSLQPIDYVPTDGLKFRPDGKNNGTYNTNDEAYYKQDSLTAYTFLDGNYKITEANAVNNSLTLGYMDVSYFDGNKTYPVKQAALTSATGNSVEFIPLSGQIGYQRKEAIKKFNGAPLNTPTGTATLFDDLSTTFGVDTLFGETYKWYLVRMNVGGKQQYLTVDTVNLAQAVGRNTIGLVFEADLVNATPVRLYQPLVGDKKNNNFLFQFYLPEYTYVYTPNTTTPSFYYANQYPDIEATAGSTQASGPVTGGGEVCFAMLSSGQSNLLYAARGYSSSIANKTRFTIIPGITEQECTSQFIDPKWMGENRLLSLPLNSQGWVAKNSIEEYIAFGPAGSANAPGFTNAIMPSGVGHRAVVQIPNTTTTATRTKVTHNYVTSIRVFNKTGETGYEPNIAKVGIPKKDGDLAGGYDSYIGGTLPAGGRIATNNAGAIDLNNNPSAPSAPSFNNDVEVPLYKISNDNNQYLTVVPYVDRRDEYSTDSDVTGIRLEWKNEIKWDATFFNTYGYDPRVVQLFAISGCKDVESGWFGKFVYLPLASYMVENYRTGDVEISGAGTDANPVKQVYYNFNLGKGDMWGGNNTTDAWRVAVVNERGKSTWDLIVANANSGVGSGSYVPMEFKLQGPTFLEKECPIVYVKNIGLGVDKQKYYFFDRKEAIADAFVDYSLMAHWNIAEDATNKLMYKFTPEVEKIYDKSVSASAEGKYQRKQLTGDYYIVNKDVTVSSTGEKGWAVLNVAGYATGDYTAKFDTLLIACPKHEVPFWDLENKENGYNINSNVLAALEYRILDRSLNWFVKEQSTDKVQQIDAKSWLSFASKVTTSDFSDAQFLKVYRSNVRALSTNHKIPYYAFSVQIPDKTTGVLKEYFLNVKEKTGNGTDSVYWTAISDNDKTLLTTGWNADPNALPTFKFCLPYRWEEREVGTGETAKKEWYRVESKYGEKYYPAVYMQTLDTSIDDRPYLVVIGDESSYVTARNLKDAMKSGYGFTYNIYDMNYTQIDLFKVTSWIFGGPQFAGNKWVPIQAVIDNIGNLKSGVLKTLVGGTYIEPSFADVPGTTHYEANKANYGQLVNTASKQLEVKFLGDNVIGTWSPRPIWYYNIIWKEGDKEYYLSDASLKNSPSPYHIPYLGNQVPYGWFVESTSDQKENPEASYAPIVADKNFIQSFGFMYVIDDSRPMEGFYIVSNANFKTNTGEYRYLSQINEQLVFVPEIEYALKFQWGKVDESGNFTDLEVIGTGGIYGVEGGVKLLNTTGKVDIFSIDGRLISSTIVNGGETIIPASRGVVIVKTGSQNVKVVVQ